jgi:hypothetical protein
MVSLPTASPDTESSTQIRSGDMAMATPSRCATIHSFWKLMVMTEPRQSSMPSKRATPRKKPSVARRSTSITLPLYKSLPGSTDRMAAMGSSCLRWASRTAWPIAMALVVVPWMPHCLTSAPVRGGWQVAATEPYSTQILRATRSVHFQVGTLSTIDSRPRTSTAVSG